MNGDNNLSLIVYFGSFIILLGTSLHIYYKYYKEKKIEELKKINTSYFFLLVFFFISLIGARSAIRLIMVLSPPTAGITGFFIADAIEKITNKKRETIELFFLILGIIVITSSAYAIYVNYNICIATAQNMVPSTYTHQWQEAMSWVRENTPENAVFSHWWDYGYWIQTIGNRATILDGGNVYAYWNHLLGRHVLTGETEQEALEFLYTHNATNLLIDSTEIGKYGAYSSIGSDKDYDRYSWLGTFILNEKQLVETKNGTIYFFQGGIALDEDYLLKEDEKTTLLPSRNTGVGALLLEREGDSFKQPKAIFVYQGKQANILLRYLYYQGELYDFKQGYEGCLYLIPKVEQEGNGMRINNLGSALFLSERNMKALWIRLYLLEEGEKFRLVHTEQDKFIKSLKENGFNIGDFVYYNGIRGPIKIWEINYPSDIKSKPEYLDTYWPEEVKIAR